MEEKEIRKNQEKVDTHIEPESPLLKKPIKKT